MPENSLTEDKKKVEAKIREDHNQLVWSYLANRRAVGVSGMLLPLILAIDPSRKSDYWGFEPSISDYYYTDRGDLLVVTLVVLAVFLISYVGYDLLERMLSAVASIGAYGVAFVPTQMICKDCVGSIHTDYRLLPHNVIGQGWHFVFAAMFLLSLAIMSIFCFTKGDVHASTIKEGSKHTQKEKRNLVYRICGWTMIGSLVILGAYFIYKNTTGHDLKPYPVVYIFETIAIEAFGLSWLVKGKTLFRDAQAPRFERP